MLFPNCSTRAEWHRHIPCGRDRHGMPVGYGETRDAREVERLRDGRDRTFVICGDIEARFRPSLTHLLSPPPSRTAATGGVFKNAAVRVLRHERRLMTTGEVTKCVRDRVRFIPPNAGVAPGATFPRGRGRAAPRARSIAPPARPSAARFRQTRVRSGAPAELDVAQVSATLRWPANARGARVDPGALPRSRAMFPEDRARFAAAAAASPRDSACLPARAVRQFVTLRVADACF